MRKGLLLFILLLAGGVAIPSTAAENSAFDQGMSAYMAKQYETAIKIWRPLAEGGDAKAQYYLGVMYADGKGVKQDYSEAIKWYRKSAERGSTIAMVALGHMYENGKGIAQDIPKALKWYKKATDKKNMTGLKGRSRYRQLAGVSAAKSELGRIYALGLGVPQNFSEARKWLWEGDSLLKAIDISEKARHLHSKSPQLFGIPLVGAMRGTLRFAAKKNGAVHLREDYNYFCDIYDSNRLLKDSTELVLCFSAKSDLNYRVGASDFFAYAEYKFPSRLDAGQIGRIERMIASKYGRPNRTSGNPEFGNASYIWFKDGVTIKVYRGWPDTTTYLRYSVPEMVKAMNAEIAAEKRKNEQRKLKAQSNAF